MTQHQTPRHEIGETVHLPLSKLVMSRENPRKTKPNTADDLLVASIRSRGLLQNLGVRPSDTSAGKYEVRYGGRRLAALRLLTKEGHFTKTQEFPCRIVPSDDADASEEALAENIVREALSPIDDFEAFAKLDALGLSVEEIAKRFGATERAVRQRLSLGQAAPCVRKALREGEISLDIAKLFAGCPDLARQERVFKAIDEGGHFSAHSVRKMLYENAVSSSDAIVKFVTLDAYEAAGGTVERDLFSDEAHLTDLELLASLRDAKLAEEVERLTADGWSWVEAHEGYAYDLMHGFDRIYGKIVEKSPEEQAERVKLEKELDVLLEKNADAEDWSDEDSERYDAIEERLDDRRDVERAFTAEQKAVAGCILYPSHDGVTVHEGLVRKEDRKKVRALTADDTGAGEGGAGGSVDVDGDDEDAPKAAPGYGLGLRSDLAVYKAQALQAALADTPETAILMHQFILVRRIFGPVFASPHGTTLQANKADLRVERGELGETTAAALLDHAERALRTDIFDSAGLIASWSAFKALEADERDSLVAFAVAMTVESMSSATTLTALVAHEMDLNIRDYWKPTGESFFARIKKDQLIAFLKETVGGDVAAKLSNDFKAKKSELVDLCDGLIHDTTPVDTKHRDALDDWAPAGMAFAAPEPDDDNVDDDEVGEDAAPGAEAEIDPGEDPATDEIAA